MSLINKEVNDFKVQAYVGKDFKEVTKKDILGKWSFSIRLILLLCARLS
jgi:alkyl hydroperoxide reductase subunit AhpC